MRRVLLLVLAAGLVLPGAADAATVSLTSVASPGAEGTAAVVTLAVDGDAGRDDLRLDGDAEALTVASADGAAVAGPGCAGGGALVRCPLVAGALSVQAHLGDGDDSVVSGIGAPTWLDGGAGDDRLESLGDLAGGSLLGATLVGGPGDDTLVGGPGEDELHPGPGSDRIEPGDRPSPAALADHLTYRDEPLPIVADLAAGTVRSGGDVDVITGPVALDGSPGDDVIAGGPGPDQLDGGPGSDRVFGGDGPDVLVAGSAPGEVDVLAGGAGNDRLSAIAGRARIDAGAGDDLVELAQTAGPPAGQAVTCGPGRDLVDGLVSVGRVDGCERIRAPKYAYVAPRTGADGERWSARVHLRCAAGLGGPCRARVVLRTASGAVLAGRDLRVRRQRPRTLTVTLGARGRRLLRAQGSLLVRLAVRVTSPGRLPVGGRVGVVLRRDG